jgi:alpha-galactosidase
LDLSQPEQPVVESGLRAEWRWEADEQGFRVWVELTNETRGPLHLEEIDVLAAPLTWPDDVGGDLAFFQNGWQSWSPTFARNLGESLYTDPGTPGYRAMHQPHPLEGDDELSSEWVTVLGPRSGGAALLAGFVTAGDQLAELRWHTADMDLVARCHLDGVQLPPGASARSEVLSLQAGPDALELLEEWAGVLGEEMQARIPENPPTGWCTWYYFYGENTSQHVLENVVAIRRHELPLDVILLDDGYQTAIGDWLSLDRYKFLDGMGPVAQTIRRAGHTLGIWTAPFGAAANSKLFTDHPDWFLRDEADEPVLGWVHWGTECYALDCTHPEVLAWLKETFGRMREGWGAEFFKVDFLFAAARPGRRHDPLATRAQALRRGLKAIREAIGEEAFLLGCGAPLGTCVGLVDGMRIGPDVDPNWHPIWRHDLSMPSTESALRNSITRAFMHGRLWANDPDCVLVRQRGTDLDLVLNEMRTLSAVTALLGGVTIDSDHLPGIRSGRLKYLRQLLPPTDLSARPLDLMANELPRLLLLEVERDWGCWWVVGSINWDDQTTETRISLEELGLPEGEYHVYHYWRRRYLGVVEDAVTVERHQPHETAVLLFKLVSDRPDLLTSTFHVCQGAAEVTGVETSEDGEETVLSVSMFKRGSQFGQLLFALPEGWTAVEARVDGLKRPLVEDVPGILSLGFTLEGEAEVDLRCTGA